MITIKRLAKRSRLIAVAAAFGSCLLPLASCSAQEPHSVGGVTVRDAFQDREIRQLAQAACAGDTGSVARLVESGADVNAAGKDGVTPLIWALSCESHAGMRALLERGADPNQRMDTVGGDTAVLFAIGYFDETLLELLLEYGGEPNSFYLGDGSDFALLTAFRFGASSDDWDTYRILVETGASPIHPEEMGPNTGLGLYTSMLSSRYYCEAWNFVERGFEPRQRVKLGLLYGAHARPGHEEECRRRLIDHLETGLTDEQWARYEAWAGNRPEPVVYGRLADPQ